MKFLFPFVCLAFFAITYGDEHLEDLATASYNQNGLVTVYTTDLINDVTTFIFEQVVNIGFEDVPQGLSREILPDVTFLISRDDGLRFIWDDDSCNYENMEFYNPYENSDRHFLYFLPFATEQPSGVYTYSQTDVSYTKKGVTYTGNITYTATLVGETISMFDALFENDIIIFHHQFNYTTFTLRSQDFSLFDLPSQCNDIRHLCTSCPTQTRIPVIDDYYVVGTLTITFTFIPSEGTAFVKNRAPFQIWRDYSKRLSRSTVDFDSYLYSGNDLAYYEWSLTECSYVGMYPDFVNSDFLYLLTVHGAEISPGVYRYQRVNENFTIVAGTFIGNYTYYLFTTDNVIDKVDGLFQGDGFEYFYQMNFTTFSTAEPDPVFFTLPSLCDDVVPLCEYCTSAANVLLPTNLIALALLFLLLIQIYQ